MDNGITTQALIRRGIEGFNRALEWWSFELGETLRLLTWFNQPNFVEFEVNDDELLPLSGEKKTAAGARRNVKLRLDDQAFLFRRIKLPTAARKNIDRVIALPGLRGLTVVASSSPPLLVKWSPNAKN